MGYLAQYKRQQRDASTDSIDSHVKHNVKDYAVPLVNIPQVIHINDSQQTCETKKDLGSKEQEQHHRYRPWEKSNEKTVDEHKYRPWEKSKKKTADEQCYPKTPSSNDYTIQIPKGLCMHD